jgi:MFS family permease
MFCTTFTAFTAFNAACCGATSLEALIVLRFFAGTFGASCLTSTGYVGLPFRFGKRSKKKEKRKNQSGNVLTSIAVSLPTCLTLLKGDQRWDCLLQRRS